MFNDSMEVFDEMDEENLRGASGPRPVEAGDVRCLRRRKLSNYWEDPRQISKPASPEEVKQFLSKMDTKPASLQSKMVMLFIICAVITFIIYNLG